MPTVLYIGQNPAAGTGSPIIVLRHLRRLADAGWNVCVLADYGGDYRECRAAGWTVTPLQHRRWWWPPYRPNSAVLSWLRLRLLARDAAAAVPRPDVVLSYLASHTDFSARLATHVANVLGAPLHMLVHDDATAFPAARGNEAAVHAAHVGILRDADVCWFVSPELADRFPQIQAGRRLLYPIPEGWERPAEWRDQLQQESRVYYAGHVWPEQLPLMGRIAETAAAVGAQVEIISKASAEVHTLCAQSGAVWRPPFPTNREVLANLVQEAAAVLVSYADTVAAMPWCATSFPSKLVEYCHLGVPVAIVAPPDSSVARWAGRLKYPYSFRPDQLAALGQWMQGLKQREVWEKRAAEALQLARGEFDPERIQADLANALRPGTERRDA